MGVFDLVTKAVDTAVRTVEEKTGIDLPGGYTREELQRRRSPRKKSESEQKAKEQARQIIKQAEEAAKVVGAVAKAAKAAGTSLEKVVTTPRVRPSRPSSPPSDTHSPSAPDLSTSETSALEEELESKIKKDRTPTLTIPAEQAAESAKYVAAETQAAAKEVEQQKAVYVMLAKGAQTLASQVESDVQRARQDVAEYVQLANTAADKLNAAASAYERGEITWEEYQRVYKQYKPIYDWATHKIEFEKSQVKQLVQAYNKQVRKVKEQFGRVKESYEKYKSKERHLQSLVKTVEEQAAANLLGAIRPPDKIHRPEEDLKNPSRAISRDVSQTTESIAKFMEESVASSAERAAEYLEGSRAAKLMPATVVVTAYGIRAAAGAVKGATLEAAEMLAAGASVPVAVVESVVKRSPQPLLESYAARYARRTAGGLLWLGRNVASVVGGTVAYGVTKDEAMLFEAATSAKDLSRLLQPEVLGETIGRGAVWAKVLPKGFRNPFKRKGKAVAVEKVTKKTPIESATPNIDDAIAAFMRREFAPKQPRADILAAYSVRRYKKPSLIPAGGDRISRIPPMRDTAVVVTPADLYKAAKRAGVRGKALKYVKSLARNKSRLSTADLERMSSMLPDETAGKVASLAVKLAKERSLTSEFLAGSVEVAVVKQIERSVQRTVRRLREPKAMKDVSRYINRKFYYAKNMRAKDHILVGKEWHIPKRRHRIGTLEGVERAAAQYSISKWASRLLPSVKYAPLAIGKLDIMSVSGVKETDIPGVGSGQLYRHGTKLKLGQLEAMAEPELEATVTTLRATKAKRLSGGRGSRGVRVLDVRAPRAPDIVRPVMPKISETKPKLQPQYRWDMEGDTMKKRTRTGKKPGFGYRELLHRIGDIFGSPRKKKVGSQKKEGKINKPQNLLV